MKTKVRTRFAPSPTGSLHIGSLRTALFAYVLAKHNKGEFILRIEDTDKKREVAGSVNEIKSMLTDFGLKWDELHIQSERVEQGIYEKMAKKLVAGGHAFYCNCQPKDVKKQGYSKQLRDDCRHKGLSEGAIKLKVPDNEEISFIDYVHGKKISWDTSTVADATLLKSDGFPTYHLAVVVDDFDMKVTHALRGHDWLPSTPIHLLVYKYLGYKMPEIGHLTDILDPEGGKLSKRKGSVNVEDMLLEGYIHDAILNFVMLLGWAPKDDREMFTLSEFVKYFDPDGFQKANPVFNRNKLDWFNQQYIQKMGPAGLAEKLSEFYEDKYKKDFLKTVTSLVQTRIKTLAEFETLAGFFHETPDVDINLLGSNYKSHLSEALKVLEKIKKWDLENINESLVRMIKSNNFHTGKFFMDFRIAVTGNKATPPINESVEILGKKESLKRLKFVLKK